MLEVRRLHLLVELRRRGTIAAVAEALHFSPSGVSQQLAQLEEEVGVQLLERVGRRVRLTEPAELLVNHAEDVIWKLERAEAQVLSLSDHVSGTVRIATFQTVALTLIPSMLKQLAPYDELRIEFVQIEPEVAVPALLARDFELIIGEEYPGFSLPLSNEVHRSVICEDALELAIPRPEAKFTYDEALVEVACCPWVLEPSGSMSRKWAVQLCREAGFEPDVRFASPDMLTHRELVLHGQAAAFLPALLTRNAPTDLVTYPTGHHRKIISAVRQGWQDHPAACAVRAALAAAHAESKALLT